MKNYRWHSLVAKVASIALVAMGNAFATMDCTGTVYFKLPEGWSSAYTVAGGQKTKFTASETYPGWLEVSASTIGAVNQVTEFFIEENGATDCNSGHCAAKNGINIIYQNVSEGTFKCTDFAKTGEIWIMAHPDPEKEGVVYIKDTKPNVKFFYLFTPSTPEWMRSVPMITTDGGKTGEALHVVEDRCGWYLKRFIDEEIPTEALIYRDDDKDLEDAIGMNGDWETADKPTPMNLSMLYEFMESDELYFVMTEEYAEITQSENLGWSTTDPVEVSAECSYNLAALIYDTDASLHPLFSCSNGPAPGNGCMDHPQSSQYDQNVAGCVGVHMNVVQETLGDDRKPHLASSTNASTCFPSEELFNQMFNYTPGVNEISCFDMPFTRASDGKWEFDSDYFTSPGAPVPGGFYPAEDNTDAIVLLANANQTPLPAARTKRKAQGPIPMKPFARAIVESEGAPLMDLVCNGPGWNGGGDCEGLYAAGGDMGDLFGMNAGDPMLWGGGPTDFPSDWTFYEQGSETITLTKQNPQWTSDPGPTDNQTEKGPGRNQHFCFESHAKFVYKPGLKFSFRGDDDIWVYIDDKLAVDLGGTHLAAPGYVDLDNFKGKSGAWVSGQTYPIDIFFCDRRTTMSNVRIKTNMYIQQTSGLSKIPVSKANGLETYELKYTKTGDGSCGSMGDEKEETHVGDDLCQYLKANGKTLDYSITTKKGTVVKTKEELAQDIVYFGGIDLTHRCDPKIDKANLGGLAPNTYYLVASVDGKTEKFQFKITGSLDIATKPARAQDEDGNLSGVYEYNPLALASTSTNPTRIPLYISSIMDEGDSLLFDISSAVDQTYSLSVTDANGVATSDVTIEYKDETGAFVTWTGAAARTIGPGGVDTIYASVPMALLTQAEQTYNVSVAGHVSGAQIKFFAPKLVFVESDTSTAVLTGDKDDYERWTGSVYEFYLLALAPSTTKPGSYEPCGERCNFALTAGSLTSKGLQVDSAGMILVNGRAKITMFSTKEYRAAANGEAANPATLAITGPNPLITANYSPLFFRNPPVPYPIFADIFDARGKKPAQEMVIKDPYFSMQQEYLDGIADSLVIYYNRPFYHNPDSLPNRIVVMWDGVGVEDSVVVTKEMFMNNMLCGAAAGLDDTLCLPRVVVSGVPFSKDVKTANPTATLLSYATFMDRNQKVEEHFSSAINDRVAPIILSASVYALDENLNRMTIQLSEEVEILKPEYTNKAFTVFLNSATSLQGDAKFVQGVESGALAPAGDKISVQFTASDENKPTPHTGDYIRFRADVPIWKDKASDVIGTDASLRPADDASYDWNVPTDYNSVLRLPSPWAAVTGEAETGVKSIKYAEVSTQIKPTELSTVKAYNVTVDFDSIMRDNPGSLGYFLKSDINSLIYSDTTLSEYFTDPLNKDKLNDVYLKFEMDVFTNLGAFVAHETKKISCTDSTIYGIGHNCLDSQRNYFVSWNGIASDGRLVGTGAYISKMKASIHLADKGNRSKMDRTETWGIRRTKKGAALQ